MAIYDLAPAPTDADVVTDGFGCQAASASQGAEAASYQQNSGIHLAVLGGLFLPAIGAVVVTWIRRRKHLTKP